MIASANLPEVSSGRWRTTPSLLDSISAPLVDLAAGRASGDVFVFVAQSGTHEDRSARPPYYLVQFDDCEWVTMQSDAFCSILDHEGRAAPVGLSETNVSELILDVTSFRPASRHFAVRGTWDYIEVIASAFSITEHESERAARLYALDERNRQ